MRLVQGPRQTRLGSSRRLKEGGTDAVDALALAQLLQADLGETKAPHGNSEPDPETDHGAAGHPEQASHSCNFCSRAVATIDGLTRDTTDQHPAHEPKSAPRRSVGFPKRLPALTERIAVTRALSCPRTPSGDTATIGSATSGARRCLIRVPNTTLTTFRVLRSSPEFPSISLPVASQFCKEFCHARLGVQVPEVRIVPE